MQGNYTKLGSLSYKSSILVNGGFVEASIMVQDHLLSLPRKCPMTWSGKYLEGWVLSTH